MSARTISDLSAVSVVIPAYEAVDLFQRSLDSALAQIDVCCEVIVVDDSPSTRIFDVVQGHAEHARVRYSAGARTGNPVDNWNAGLRLASHEARLLLQQDDWLADAHYFARALSLMNARRAAAVVARTEVTGVRRASRHRMITGLRRVPGARNLLPLMNWVGPTAAFLFRGDHLFDSSFRWMVDVEFYMRVMQTGPVAWLPRLSIISLGHHDRSITATLDQTRLAIGELHLMTRKRPPILSRRRAALYAAAVRARGLLRRFGV